jgi:hypothetical protein
MKLSQLLWFSILVLALACSTQNPSENSNSLNTNSNSVSTSSPQENKGENYSVVLSVPIGEAGISYANLNEQESEPLGPSGFAIDDDGNVVIVDTVANRRINFTLRDFSQPSSLSPNNPSRHQDQREIIQHVRLLEES